MKENETLIKIKPRANGVVLEGALVSCSAEHGMVIAPPHPLYGGSMSSPVVQQLVKASRRQNISSIRFEWRGIGGSSGTPSGASGDADLDYGAALDLISEAVNGAIIASGYSFGSLAAHRAAANPRVVGLILVAPPAEYFDQDALTRLEKPVLLVAGEYDRVAPAEELSLLCDKEGFVQLKIIKGADHFFGQGLREIGTGAYNWLVDFFKNEAR